MLLVELLERVANRLDAAARLLGQPPGDLGRAAAGLRQAPRALDDLAALVVGQLAELRAAAHALLVLRHEALDRALQEADPLAAVEHEPPADQPLLAPAGNRLGRDVELLGSALRRSARARRPPSAGTSAASDRSSTNSRRSWPASLPGQLQVRDTTRAGSR